jgi:hypothetical protein
MWDLTRYALEFFQQHLSLADMTPDDSLVEGDGAWCLARAGHGYAVYAWRPDGLRLRLPLGTYRVEWYDPRHGGPLVAGRTVKGPGKASLGAPPRDPDKDWAILVRREKEGPR